MTTETLGYFQALPPNEDNEVWFYIVKKSDWDHYQCLGDCVSPDELVPDEFYRATECLFEHGYNSIDDAKEILVVAGFTEKVLIEPEINFKSSAYK